MGLSPRILMLAGAIITGLLAIFGARLTGAPLTERLEAKALAVIAEHGIITVRPRFSTASGWPSRHPQLLVRGEIDENVRADIATAIAAIPGVGGVRWSDGTIIAESGERPLTPMHCQEDVKALLGARTIRFEESSSEMEPASEELLDEVAAALRPCLGAIIAVNGHTDSSGPEPENQQLSRERALVVRRQLVERGIPRDAMRALGYGSEIPVDGLDPADPANRRIEFSVISTAPIKPTPIDTPAPR